MTDDMREHGTIAIDAAHPARIVIHIRQADAELVVIRNGLAQFVESAGVRHQVLAVLPQRAQVEVQLAFIVDQQRTVPFALHDRAAVRRLQAEIIALPLRMVAVMADAIFDPVFQALDGQLIQQRRCLLEKIRQSGAGEGLMDAWMEPVVRSMKSRARSR